MMSSEIETITLDSAVSSSVLRSRPEMPAKHTGHTWPICVHLPRRSVRAGRDPGGALW
jgi:hypothetical protein